MSLSFSRSPTNGPSLSTWHMVQKWGFSLLFFCPFTLEAIMQTFLPLFPHISRIFQAKLKHINKINLNRTYFWGEEVFPYVFKVWALGLWFHWVTAWLRARLARTLSHCFFHINIMITFQRPNSHCLSQPTRMSHLCEFWLLLEYMFWDCFFHVNNVFPTRHSALSVQGLCHIFSVVSATMKGFDW